MPATLELASQLIACASVSPDDAHCQNLIGERLAKMGFELDFVVCGPDDWRVTNLWAKRLATPVNQAFVAIEKIAIAAQAVLDARAVHASASLAALYGDTMPVDLQAAHKNLDKAVDVAYGFKSTAKTTDADRVAFLFDRYEQLVLHVAEKAQTTPKETNDPQQS